MEATQTLGTPRAHGRRRSAAAALRPILVYLGVLCAVASGAALLALYARPPGQDSGWLADDGHAGHSAVSAAEATPIHILQPSPGSASAERVPLVFATEVPLENSPHGWGARGLHLHASVNGAEIMSGGARIESLGGNRYRWELPLVPGTYRVELFWASHGHGRIAHGAATPIDVIVRGPNGPPTS